ncbi:unnamed protein product [Acanthoscelides obtectus]|uniref:Uncharacterized protein n=1 Tax=Acanthoscelides obtectus TaxID=200917 RepID=A0A9P0MKE8_ACAOB|nr:unnamed protein product [Acanthoscelides obtectus]CAK1658909.1 hypothetical protein AOBTE_LOCUS21195 [Acanthoscelides obtectus]
MVSMLQSVRDPLSSQSTFESAPGGESVSQAESQMSGSKSQMSRSKSQTVTNRSWCYDSGMSDDSSVADASSAMDRITRLRSKSHSRCLRSYHEDALIITWK